MDLAKTPIPRSTPILAVSLGPHANPRATVALTMVSHPTQSISFIEQGMGFGTGWIWTFFGVVLTVYLTARLTIWATRKRLVRRAKGETLKDAILECFEEQELRRKIGDVFAEHEEWIDSADAEKVHQIWKKAKAKMEGAYAL